MPDNPDIRSGSDRKRINVNQGLELRDGSARFGVTKDQLKEAVAAVGDNAAKVEAHLRSGTGAAGRGKKPEGQSSSRKG